MAWSSFRCCCFPAGEHAGADGLISLLHHGPVIGAEGRGGKADTVGEAVVGPVFPCVTNGHGLGDFGADDDDGRTENFGLGGLPLLVGGTPITITGTNLTGTSVLTIGGIGATTVIVANPTTVTAITPAGTAGAKTISLTTPGGTA